MENIKHPLIKRIIHKVALKNNLTDAEATEAVTLEFAWANNLIQSGVKEIGDFANFRLPMFGGFYVSNNKRNFNKTIFNGSENKDTMGGE